MTRFVLACCQKGSLPSAEEIRHQRGDAVRQGVGVEVVVQRVVAVRRVETDFDVVVAAAVALEDVADVLAEVALHFQDQAADLPRGIARRDTRAAARRRDTDRPTSCPCRWRR